MNSDPIEDSSPVKSRNFDSEDDSGDDLFNDFDEKTFQMTNTVPTQPVRNAFMPSGPVPTPSSRIASSPHYMTQPTQLLTSSQKTTATQVLNTPQRPSQIQVPASSSPTQPSTRISGIAPPGTQFRPPILPRAIFTNNPQTQMTDIEDSDPQISADSDSDDGLSNSRSDIPSSFGPGRNNFKLSLSSFAYKSQVPQKRTGDDMTSAYANASRLSKAPRQTGPSRAVEAASDQINTLDDILDWDDRNKIQQLIPIFPDRPIAKLYSALRLKRGNVNDAQDYLVELQEKEEENKAIDLTASDNEGTGVAKLKTAKPEVVPAKKTKTMREKYSKILPNTSQSQNHKSQSQIQPKLSSPTAVTPPPKKFKRLMQGRRAAPASPIAFSPSPQKIPIREVIDIDSGSEAGNDSEDEEPSSALEDRLLQIFNSCTEKELIDLVGSSAEEAALVISKRPFRNLDSVRKVAQVQAPATNGKKKGGSKVTLGERIVSKAIETETSLEAVDRIVAQCDRFTRDVQKDMKKWGVNTTTGESLDIVSLQDKHDSGTGTPTSSASSEKNVTTSPHEKFLRQPENMSPDITMKDYQIVGLNWLNLLWSKQHSWSQNDEESPVGCILADDMGLGKTCQVIAFLSHLLEAGVDGPHLIVVPASTIENWMREMEKFSPTLHFEPYYGLQKEREGMRQTIYESIDDINVIVTTYDTATKEDDNKFLRRLNLKSCIFDEGHALKNSHSSRYKQLRRIKTSFRLLLTGTPLQNNLQELMSVLAFIMPGLFDECRDEFSLIFNHRATTADKDHAALLSAKRIARAKSMLTPFILRRTKAQVMKDLPKKTKRVEYCSMTTRQEKYYNNFADMHNEALAARKAGVTTNNFPHLMLRRQAAIHPLLLNHRQYDHTEIELYDRATIDKMWPRIPREKGKYKKYISDEGMREHLLEKSDFQLHMLCSEVPQLKKFALKKDEWMDSGKVDKVVELVQKFTKEGSRTLIFSHFTSMLDILEAVFDTVGISRRRIDGSTPVNDRQGLIDEFYDDESIEVFMLSTRSGGAGINLACANKVIIFDSGFNPQDDIQAENRAHRIGQTRDVEVVTLITTGTIEEQIYALGESKRLLDDRVTGGDEDDSKIENKTIEELERLLMEKVETPKQEEVQERPTDDLKDAFRKGLKSRGVVVADD
jgi:SWI/SNF-related matrix-associated actin-dependent regulator 1 of chromatin subfamily A